VDGNKTKSSISASPLEWAALVLGITALGASVTLSESWSEYNGQGVFFSWIMAITFVGFTNLVFEVGYGLFVRARNGSITIRNYAGKDLKEGRKIVNLRYLGGVLCIVLSMLMETYNITAIVGAQYNALVANRVTSPEVVLTQSVDDVASKKTLQEENKTKARADNEQLKTDFDKVTADYKKHLKEYTDLKPSELDALPITTAYVRATDMYNASKKANDDKYDAAQTALIKLADDAAKAKNVGKTNEALFHGSVYTYLKGVTGIDEIYLQFGLTALPALFFGLISCLSLAFFLYRKPASDTRDGTSRK
jgi:hypothetical protein